MRPRLDSGVRKKIVDLVVYFGYATFALLVALIATALILISFGLVVLLLLILTVALIMRPRLDSGVRKKIADLVVYFGYATFALLAIHILINAGFYFAGDFDLEFDKKYYFENEDDAFLEIHPSGIYKPCLHKVTYLNQTILNRTELQKIPCLRKNRFLSPN